MNNLYKEISALLMNDDQHRRAVNTISIEVMKPLTMYWRQQLQRRENIDKFLHKDSDCICLPEQEAASEFIDELLLSFFNVACLDNTLEHVSEKDIPFYYNQFKSCFTAIQARAMEQLAEIDSYMQEVVK